MSLPRLEFPSTRDVHGAVVRRSTGGRASRFDRQSPGIEVFKDVIPQVGQTVLVAPP
jgi:hypothetical protein